MYDVTCISHVTYITYIHDLAGYAKKGRHFVYDFSLENSEDILSLFFTGSTSFRVLVLCLYQSPSSSLCTYFDAVHLTDKILSNNLSANAFALRELVNFFVGLIDLVKDVTQLVSFPSQIITVLLFFMFLFTDPEFVLDSPSLH